MSHQKRGDKISWQSNGSNNIEIAYFILHNISFLLQKISNKYMGALIRWLLTFYIRFCCSFSFDFRAILMLIYDCKWNSNKLKRKCFQRSASWKGKCLWEKFKVNWIPPTPVGYKYTWWLFILKENIYAAGDTEFFFA